MARDRILPRWWLGTMVAGSIVATGPWVAAGEPVAVPVVFHLDWAEGTRGSTVLRDDIARAALDAIATRGCFREIAGEVPAEGPALRLDVELWDLVEETLFDDSLAARTDPSRPDQGLRVTAVFSILVGWELHAAASPIERRRFKIERRRRPMTFDEDPAQWARGEAIDAIGRELARAVCSVPRRKIDAALAGTAR